MVGEITEVSLKNVYHFFCPGGGAKLSRPPSWTKDNYAFLISYADGKKNLAYFIVYESIVSAWNLGVSQNWYELVKVVNEWNDKLLVINVTVLRFEWLMIKENHEIKMFSAYR